MAHFGTIASNGAKCAGDMAIFFLGQDGPGDWDRYIAWISCEQMLKYDHVKQERERGAFRYAGNIDEYNSSYWAGRLEEILA